jgi:hypothetical protein
MDMQTMQTKTDFSLHKLSGYLRLAFILSIWLFPQLAYGSALSDLAASMQPGTWAQLTGTNAGLLSTQWPTGYGHGFDDGNMAWNSKKRMLLHTSADHGPHVDCSRFPNPPGICFKALMTYTDATNTWAVGGAIPPQVVGWHGYDNVAWDDVNEVMYIHEFASGRFFRYCVNNTPSWCSGKQDTWSLVGSSPTSLLPCCSIGAISYHPTMDGGSLLFFNGDSYGSGHGALLQYRESTNTWTVLAGAGRYFTNGDYSNVIEHSPLKRVTIFGGGSGNIACGPGSGCRKLWKIDDGKNITALTDAPFDISFGATSTRTALADPVTGDFIFVYGESNDGVSTTKAELWKLNPDGNGTWTRLDSDLRAAGKPCSSAFIKPCPNDFFGTAVSTYGVLLFWKLTGNTTAEVWLYKPGGSAPAGTVLDTSPPTVSITTPIPGSMVSGNVVNVSAAAFDNIGVVGVQFTLDGNNVGAEATSSPFLVSWNTTLIADGNHTLTAIARDAAGNSMVSIPVTITVSNAAAGTTSNAGGSDFASRCAAPGVVRCIAFDSASELTNTAWGGNTGLDVTYAVPADYPVIDTANKASGNGSLKFTISSNTGAAGAGAYWANFSPDLSVRFGAGQSFYLQWRQRFSPEFLNTVYRKIGGGNAGGWKTTIITTGDFVGTCQSRDCQQIGSIAAFSSCTALDVPTQNTEQRGFIQAYHSCRGSASHGPYDAFNQNFNGDFKLQNARPSPYCLYTQGPNFFPPNGNCIPFVANEWMTFKVQIILGTRVNDEYVGSRFKMWVAREGQPSQMVLDWNGPNNTGYNLSAGSIAENQRLGKIYLTPYHTAKDPTQSHPTAYTWYDELIISTQDIADPGVSNVTTPPPAPSGLVLR